MAPSSDRASAALEAMSTEGAGPNYVVVEPRTSNLQSLLAGQAGLSAASGDELRVSRLIHAMSVFDVPHSASSMLNTPSVSSVELHLAAAY